MQLPHPDAGIVDVATGAEFRGVELAERTHAAADAFGDLLSGVAFLRIPTSVDAVVRYLGAWQARRPLALLDPGLAPERLTDFVDRFEPAVVVGFDTDADPVEMPPGYRHGEHTPLGPLWERQEPAEHTPHPDLAVLLASSGSTGDPKLIRLSRAAILANTGSIIEVLGIGPDDVTISSLPFFYSFGMSVLNTHLAAGATIVIESDGLLHRPFWEAVNAHQVTSMALVPAQYEMLRRLRFDPTNYPTLRTLTQAGGRLRPEVVLDFHRRMTSVGGRLFAMYGQTEAGPRLTTLPTTRLAEKAGSVGPAIPGGHLSVRLDDGTESTEPGLRGEVIYNGPNVMMGYAERGADLALGDTMGGRLATGDLGHLDTEGFLYIDGRLNRFGKVFGVRLNLDDIENLLQDLGHVAAVAGDDKIIVWVEGGDAVALAPRVTELADRLRLHWSGLDVRGTAALPLLSNGKVDYRALEHEE